MRLQIIRNLAVADISINTQQVGVLFHLVLDKIHGGSRNQSRARVLDGKGRCTASCNALIQDTVFEQSVFQFWNLLDSCSLFWGCNNSSFHISRIIKGKEFHRIFSVCETSFIKEISFPTQKICDQQPRIRTASSAVPIAFNNRISYMDEIPYLEWICKDTTLSPKIQIFNIIFWVNFAGNFYTFDTQPKNSTTWIFTNMCIALAIVCFLPLN